MAVFHWIKKEFFRLFPVFLFFFLFFFLINWVEIYLFEEAGMKPFRFVDVVVAAALIAKIFLVGDHLPLIDFLKKWPLIYRISWKTLFYWVLLIIVRLLIRYAPFFFTAGEGEDFGFKTFIEEVNWRLFISFQVFYLMILFMFVTFRELTYKIGHKKMKILFFG